MSKYSDFQDLHASTFLIPNAWDPGSAKMLASLGFRALATSSSASAAVQGLKDGQLGKAAVLAHAKSIVDAVDLPVSADLENGFGHRPEDAADTIREAVAIGLAGGSIEDATGDADKPLYGFDDAVARVAAAVQAARQAGRPFVLTARAENFLRGNPSLDDTIRRLQAFERAGADVLFAPGLPDLDAVRAVCAALNKPVNFMVAFKGKSFTVAELQAAGVKRISLAGSLYRAAMNAAQAAAREALSQGTFGYIETP
jgi:2-methylisocitrate lyase-like PEP mutase family enzyme